MSSDSLQSMRLIGERDIPSTDWTSNDWWEGWFHYKVKKGEKIVSIHYDFHPLDVVGWDGFYFPWSSTSMTSCLSPGRSTCHLRFIQTFHAPGFVICSFCPRLLDYHPLACRSLQSQQSGFWWDALLRWRKFYKQKRNWLCFDQLTPERNSPRSASGNCGSQSW